MYVICKELSRSFVFGESKKSIEEIIPSVQRLGLVGVVLIRTTIGMKHVKHVPVFCRYILRVHLESCEQIVLANSDYIDDPTAIDR